MRHKLIPYDTLCRLSGNKRQQIMIVTIGSLIINLLYAVYNGVLGIWGQSVWFITMGMYYAVLSIMRVLAVKGEYRSVRTVRMLRELSIMKTVGILLFLLTFILTGSIYLSLKYDLPKRYGTIIMITIATYTFVKVVMAVINFVKARKHYTPLIITIRNISISDALVSLLSMQMSMYATFSRRETDNSYIMHVITGAGVCLCIVLIGVSMIRYSVKMSKNITVIKGPVEK